MAERVVSVELVANASGLVRGIQQAKASVGELKNEVQASTMSQREAWAQIGTGLTGVGVAMTGVMALTLKTGIAYNTLQQTSRAALTTLLGSARAANAQMDKLDDFARNSPFSKQTFIQAQQQMLAFGIETEKVIPYLDAVQNGVAAMGGSNQQISEIAFIMSQISAASKITGQDLIQFGQRGINAAELIGSQMGKTGGEIRAEITAGTLDANQALDALAAGMEQRFGGAAANVKNTFEGAMDRVKAAFRDFASELAKPLVDPNGGGALIDLLNWTADAMRNFEKLPEPVKATVSALTGLVGVGSLLAGTAILALPKWLEFQAALRAVGVTGTSVRAGLGGIVRFLGGPWGIAMLAAAATVAVFNKAMDESKVSSQQFETSIKQGKSALGEMRASAEANEQGLTKLFVDVSSQVENLGPLLDKAATSGRGFFSSLSFNEQGALDDIANFGDALSNLAATDLPRAQREFARFGEEADLSREQLATALGEMPAFKDALLDYADSAGLATDDTTLLKLAMGEIGPAAGQNANSLEELAGIAATTTNAISNLADEILNFGNAQISADKAAIQLQEAIADLNGIVKDGHAELGIYTDNGRKAESAMIAIAESAKKSAAATLEAGGSQEDMNAILDDARQKLIDARVAMGEDQAAARAWANERVPQARQVAKALDKVKSSADAIPGSRTINVSATGNALSVIQKVNRALAATSKYKNISISATGGVYGLAHGGTVGYAQGGTIARAATGITVGGIGGGIASGTVYGAGTAKSDSVLVRLSKGEEVTQEPYASMYRPWLKAMNRGDFVPGSPVAVQSVGAAGPVQVSLDGATIRADLDGVPLDLRIRGQVLSAFAGGSSGVLSSRLGVRTA